jgi:hypothetical protein
MLQFTKLLLQRNQNEARNVTCVVFVRLSLQESTIQINIGKHIIVILILAQLAFKL